MQVRYQLRHSPEFLGEEPTSRKQPVYLKPQFLPTRIGIRQAEKPWSGPRFGPEMRHEKIRRDQSIPADYPVELRGLEPLTPCMPCRCATSCATAPNFRCSGPSAHASVTGTLSGSLRSNSNILEHPFRKFQIGHIRGLSRRTAGCYSVSEAAGAFAEASSPSWRSTTGQSFQRRSRA
jgi:hypothetical protein